MSLIALTPLQAKSYKFIQGYLATNRLSPTAQEITDYLEKKSSSIGQNAKDTLIRKGLIELSGSCIEIKTAPSRAIKSSDKKLCYKPKIGFVLSDGRDPLALTHSAFRGQADFVLQYDDSINHDSTVDFLNGDKIAFSFVTEESDLNDLDATFLIMGVGYKSPKLIKNNKKNRAFLKKVYDKSNLVSKYLGLSRTLNQFNIE